MVHRGLDLLNFSYTVWNKDITNNSQKPCHHEVATGNYEKSVGLQYQVQNAQQMPRLCRLDLDFL